MHVPQTLVFLALIVPCVALGLSPPADATCNSSVADEIALVQMNLKVKQHRGAADVGGLHAEQLEERAAADVGGLNAEQLEEMEMGESPCNMVVSAPMAKDTHGTHWQDHPTCMKCTGMPAGAKPFTNALGMSKTYTGCQWKGDKGSNSAKMCRMKVKDATPTAGYAQTPKECKTNWEKAGGGQVHFSWWCAGASKYIDAATINPTKIAGLVKDAKKVHFWYDAELNQELKTAIEAIPKMTTHVLDRNGVKALVKGTPLENKEEQIWKTLLAFRHMGGNGCAAGKNFLSYLILNKHGGIHLDASIQVLDDAAFVKGLLEPADFALFPQKAVYNKADKVFLEDVSALATIASGQQWKNIPTKPRPTDPVMRPQADPVDAPAVDVWAIKSPSNDMVLQEIAKALLVRGEKYGLLEETGGKPDPGKSTKVPMCWMKRSHLIEAGIACNGLKFMKDVFECKFKRTYKNGKDGTTSEEMINGAQVRTHLSTKVPQGKTYKLHGSIESQTIQSSFVKTLSMAAVGVGLLKGNTVQQSEDKLVNARKFNTITYQNNPKAGPQKGKPIVAEWGILKVFAQTHAQHNKRL